MTIQQALQELLDKGANIDQVGEDEFMIYDNGFWGFCEEEDPFVVDGDEILELHEKYCS